MSFSIEFIKDYFNQIEDDKLNKLIEYSFKSKFYLSVILLDFTYLNKRFGYSAGDYLKEEVELFLKKYLDSNVIYYTITSSKIFLYTKKPANESFKKSINNLKKKLIFQGFDTNGKEVIFYVEKSRLNKNYYTITNNVSIEFMLNKALFQEFNLNLRRNYVQSYFNELFEVGTNELNIMKINQKYDDGFKEKELDFKIKEFNSQTFDDIYEKIKNKNIIQNSDYLTQAFEILKNRYGDWNYYFIEFRKLISKYLIWVEMQKLLLDATIVEKSNSFFYRENKETYDKEGNLSIPDNEKIIRFDTNQGLMNWFDSVVRTIEHTYLTNKEKEKIEEIRKKILNLDLNQKNNNENKLKFTKLVQDLFDNVCIKGLYNIPLEKLKPSNFVDKVFVEQLYLYFGSNYSNKYTQWRKSNFLKEGYYTFVKLPQLMNQTFDFFELEENNLILNFGFLEIDGFNSFNTYYFPNDKDSIMYSKIIESIYLVLNDFLLHSNSEKQNFFSKIIISVMGDEFFFLIPREKSLNKSEKRWFKEFLEAIRVSILDIAKNIKFYETDKINVYSNNSQVTFRKVLVEEKSFSKKNVFLPIATIGVSGIIRYDIKYNKDQFSKEIDKLDNEMKEIKSNPKEKGRINVGK